MADGSQKPNTAYLVAAGVAAAVSAAGWLSGAPGAFAPAFVCSLTLLAVYFQRHPTLHVLTFTIWVAIATIAALFWPGLFLEWGGFQLNSITIYLVQLIMFSMGATLSVQDFANALKMPKAVAVGILLQFSVMPLVGWAVATALGFEPEVAAGIILIGSCSGGVASNVMAFLARGNVALSVTMTACSTLLAPLMTPLLMESLAGRLIEIDFWAMVLSIINIVIIPIGGGLIVSRVIEQRRDVSSLARTILPLALAYGFGVAAATGAVQMLGGASLDSAFLAAKARQAVLLTGLIAILGFALNATLAGKREAFMKYPPVISMASICAFLAIATAYSRDALVSIGLLLVVAAFLHNVIGYVFGYWLAAAGGVKGADRRTVAFEVGMQNGGMAGGLALLLGSAGALLAPIVFSTVMNVTGSLIASWWRDKPAPEEAAA